MILESLDIRSLSLALGLVILSLGMCMTSFMVMRRTYKGFREWTVASLAMGLGILLGVFREYLNPFIPIVIGNVFIAMAMGAYYEGLRVHAGMRNHALPHIPIVAFCSLILYSYFLYIHPSVNIRISISSLLCGAYFFLAFIHAIRSSINTLTKLHKLLIVAHLGMACLFVFRGVYFLLPSQTLDSYLTGGAIHSFLILSLIPLSVILIVALIQMNAYKLELELREKSALAQDNEEKFRLLSEQAMMSIAVVQESGLRYYNKAFLEMTEYSKEELSAMSFEEMRKMVHPEYCDFVMDQGRKKIRGETDGVVDRYLYKGLKKSGEEVWIEQFSKSVLWEGKPANFMSLIDTTAKKKAEEELRDSEEKYRILVENALDAVYITQNGRFLFCNQVVESIIGYTMEEMLEIPFAELIHPDDRDMIVDRHYKRLQGESPPSGYSFRFFSKQGEVKWGQMNVARVKWEGKDAILAVLRDITRQTELEMQVRQAHKMEAIGTLSGGIAHEFNNLLGIIVGNAEMALDDIASREPVHEFIEEILIASSRGEEVVRQLLSVSRPSMPVRVPVDIPSTVVETLGLLRASIPTSVAFRTDLPKNCKACLGDPTQIRQVIINLCKNAAHALNGESGAITIKARNVQSIEPEIFHDQTLPPGDYLSLEIQDNGQGISADRLNRIFDPFYTTKDVGEGSGMGLSVVRGIMKGHDGGIRITSTVGSGTKVQCFFPASGEAMPVAEQEQRDVMGGTESILYLDDEEGINKMAKKRLERMGYAVETATDPHAALKAFLDNPGRFDIVITDLTMPAMSGDMVIARLKAIDPDVKTIICSGYNEKIDDHTARKMGAGAFLTKPVKKSHLAATIRRVLDNP